MGQPATQYADADGVHLAYQVIGDGPVDLIWAYGLASNIEVFWEEPSQAALLRRLGEFSRLITFDRRGCGLSDRGAGLATPTLEERVEDIVAVLDAVGSERASILGVSEGAGVAALMASTHPHRTASVIFHGPVCRLAGLEHPLGWHDEDVLQQFLAIMVEGWGSDDLAAAFAVPLWAPSMVGDPEFVRWLGRYMRQSVSRNEIEPLLVTQWGYDLADVFPAVRVPALVLARRGDRLAPLGYARRIAAMVPDAHLVELDGADHLPFAGDFEAVAAEIEEFLVGARSAGMRTRRLVTLLFTDIVQSTRQIADRGDEVWRERLAAHDDDVRRHLARFGGQEVKHLGDGFLTSFDGPARAIRCALGLADAAEHLGLSLRIGVHTGECDVVDDDVRGIAVHVAARLVDLAEPGEILASATVRDLVAGSGIRFAERRDVEVPGLDGSRPVFPVVRHGAPPDVARRLAGERANVLHRDGEHWTVGYRGVVVSLRDSKGIRDLARLLSEPGRELHVMDLMSGGGRGASVRSALTAEAGLTVGGSGEVLLDDTAKAAYQHRITELEEQLEEARELGQPERASRAQAERDALVAELAAAYGLGGRARRAPDDVERCRKAVTRRLRGALDRVGRSHPRLGRHLDASIRTGTYCSYVPERATVWSVETDRR